MISTGIIEPFNKILVPNYRSYWATHFYSIICCLHHHKNLEYSPRRMDIFPLWSLCSLRGSLPSNFFLIIKRYIANWGYQYFIANFLNQKMSFEIVQELVNRIQNLYDIYIIGELSGFGFYVSGNDSGLSLDLGEKFTRTFPSSNESCYKKLIAQSDLCLILESPTDEDYIAIFGEVEGVYGNKLTKPSYWEGKQDNCVFGIGVLDNIDSNGIYFQDFNYDRHKKVNLLFDISNFVVEDFLETLEFFNHIFHSGPSYKYRSKSDDFNFFSFYLKNNWNKPIEEILAYLELFIDSNDLVGRNTGILPIITDLQS